MQNCHYIILLTYYQTHGFQKKTVTRFIADDKVVYERLRRATRLASDNYSWAWHCLKHLSWRSRWIILCTLKWGVPVSRKISRVERCVFGLSSWLRTKSSTLNNQLLSSLLWYFMRLPWQTRKISEERRHELIIQSRSENVGGCDQASEFAMETHPFSPHAHVPCCRGRQRKKRAVQTI